MKCKCDRLGKTPDGLDVSAITDAMGPQIVVKGDKTHLLSQEFTSHKEAVRVGKLVVKQGISAYDRWVDIFNNPGLNLFEIMSSISGFKR